MYVTTNTERVSFAESVEGVTFTREPGLEERIFPLGDIFNKQEIYYASRRIKKGDTVFLSDFLDKVTLSSTDNSEPLNIAAIEGLSNLIGVVVGGEYSNKTGLVYKVKGLSDGVILTLQKGDVYNLSPDVNFDNNSLTISFSERIATFALKEAQREYEFQKEKRNNIMKLCLTMAVENLLAGHYHLSTEYFFYLSNSNRQGAIEIVNSSYERIRTQLLNKTKSRPIHDVKDLQRGDIVFGYFGNPELELYIFKRITSMSGTMLDENTPRRAVLVPFYSIKNGEKIDLREIHLPGGLSESNLFTTEQLQGMKALTKEQYGRFLLRFERRKVLASGEFTRILFRGARKYLNLYYKELKKAVGEKARSRIIDTML